MSELTTPLGLGHGTITIEGVTADGTYDFKITVPNFHCTSFDDIQLVETFDDDVYRYTEKVRLTKPAEYRLKMDVLLLIDEDKVMLTEIKKKEEKG